jgi:hypothetical protein
MAEWHPTANTAAQMIADASRILCMVPFLSRFVFGSPRYREKRPTLSRHAQTVPVAASLAARTVAQSGLWQSNAHF